MKKTSNSENVCERVDNQTLRLCGNLDRKPRQEPKFALENWIARQGEDGKDYQAIKVLTPPMTAVKVTRAVVKTEKAKPKAIEAR